MKVAVCLFGLPRGNNGTWQSLISNVCVPLDADLFVHTWNLEENVETHLGFKQPGLDKSIKLTRFLNKNYSKTQSVIIEKQSQYIPRIIEMPWGTVYYSNQINMFKSMLNVSKLCIDKGSYDSIIFTRSDILFKKPFRRNYILDCEHMHGGIAQKDVGIDFDDVFFVLSKVSPVTIFMEILSGYNKMYYLNKCVYNVLPCAINDLGLTSKSLEYKYGSSFNIYRDRNLTNLLIRLQKKFSRILKLTFNLIRSLL